MYKHLTAAVVRLAWALPLKSLPRAVVSSPPFSCIFFQLQALAYKQLAALSDFASRAQVMASDGVSYFEEPTTGSGGSGSSSHCNCTAYCQKNLRTATRQCTGRQDIMQAALAGKTLTGDFNRTCIVLYTGPILGRPENAMRCSQMSL